MVCRLAWATEMYADQVVDLDLPSDNLDLDDGGSYDLTVMGFGTLRSGGSTPSNLQEVQVPYVPNDSCGSYPSNEIYPSMLCAGYLSGGYDACQGDSGGPIGLEVNGAWRQVGVVSW